MFGSEFSYFGFKDAINGPVLPPVGSGIDRRFQKRVDGDLIDSIAGRDATVLFPVSEFNGVDGFVEFPEFNFEVGKFIEFNIKNNNVSLGHIFGSASPIFNGIRFTGSDLSILIGSGNVSTLSSVLNIGAIAKLKLHRMSISDIDVYKNDVNIGTISNTGYTSDCLLQFIGKRHDGFYMNGNLWDVNLNNELFIPLPHLKGEQLSPTTYRGYGYDQNGDAVELTITGGVSEGYDENGSRHLVEKGAVARNPELNANPNFENGLDDYIVVNADATHRVDIEDAGVRYIADTISPVLVLKSSSNVANINITIELDIEVVSGSIKIQQSGIDSGKLNTTGTHVFSGTPTGTNLDILRDDSNTDILIKRWSIKLATPDYIPNNDQGQPIVTLVDGDTFISGTPFLNATPWRIRLFTLGDTDPEYTFFDKSNTAIYEAAVQASDNYIVGDTGNFHQREIMQSWIWDNIKVAFKYKWWVRLIGGIYRDLFFYNTALSDSDDISNATDYTNTPEP